MRRTQENLERLADLREEMGRQLERLSRQARTAERYTELRREERALAARLKALRHRQLDEQLAAERRGRRALEVELEELAARRAACDAAIERLRGELAERGRELESAQGDFYARGAEIVRLEQALEHRRRRRRELVEEQRRAERALGDAERQLAEDRQRAARWEAELAELRPRLETFREREQELARAQEAAEAAMADWQERWEAFNAASGAARREAEVEQSRIQHLEENLRRLAAQIRAREAEHAGLDAGPAREELATTRAALAELEAEQAELRAGLEAATAQMAAVREEGAGLEAEAAALREQLQTAKGRRASLEALQQAALARDEGATPLAGLADAPALAERLEVEPGWEAAVEVVLGHRLRARCVADLEAHLDALAGLERGELALVAEGASAPSTGEALGARVKGPGGALLAGVYPAEDLAQARTLLSRLRPGESVVTRDGVWLGPGWALVARRQDPAAGVLARRRELAALQGELERLAAMLARVEERRAQVAERRRLLEGQRDALARRLAEAERRHAQLSSRIGALAARIEQVEERRRRLDGELAEAAGQQREEERRLAEARARLDAALERMAADQRAREQLLGERDALRSRLDRSRQEARHARDRCHELAMRERSAATQLAAIHEGIARLEAQRAQLAERLAEMGASPDLDESGDAALSAELERQLEARLAAEDRLAAARRAVETLEAALREREAERAELEQIIAERRSQLESRRLAERELETRAHTIAEELAAAGADLDALLAELPEDADATAWEAELKALGERIQRLGPINLAAIEEYQQEAERKRYLDAQDAELREALATLESAIRKIDRETRSRFRETFEAVNASLGELFPKVFGGGHAYLELVGDDLLEAGVALMARPPGKRNTTIHLLSGGEKALTAIALVFAIFRLNPAPFCLLDEVDAPLDDANVGRFAALLKEMSGQVQFVYITHNKLSMEIADQLLGVTMQEPGVSRLVSVDVERALELAEA
ncbi:MAG: chromosome partition protein Smc [Porticoccaceae bacterium]|nr:MAG: chromosome partition protein Smc [Porticoccaceae bacterium]